MCADDRLFSVHVCEFVKFNIKLYPCVVVCVLMIVCSVFVYVNLSSLISSCTRVLLCMRRPSSGVTNVISNYAAAAQIGAAPGAGAGVTQITDEERRRILEEEQRQLDQMKVSLLQIA